MASRPRRKSAPPSGHVAEAWARRLETLSRAAVAQVWNMLPEHAAQVVWSPYLRSPRASTYAAFTVHVLVEPLGYGVENQPVDPYTYEGEEERYNELLGVLDEMGGGDFTAEWDSLNAGIIELVFAPRARR